MEAWCSRETLDPPPPDSDLAWPPFRSFGREYYTYQLLLDLKVGPEWAVRSEPHPRFYTDTTDTVPVAVPALLRTEWWPMISFAVFEIPGRGSHAHLSPRRTDDAVFNFAGRGRLYACPYGRRRIGRTRVAGAANSREPGYTGDGINVGVENRYGVRRHLSPSAPRSEVEEKGKIALRPGGRNRGRDDGGGDVGQVRDTANTLVAFTSSAYVPSGTKVDQLAVIVLIRLPSRPSWP